VCSSDLPNTPKPQNPFAYAKYNINDDHSFHLENFFMRAFWAACRVLGLFFFLVQKV
jgi:hypothetical protein